MVTPRIDAIAKAYPIVADVAEECAAILDEHGHEVALGFLRLRCVNINASIYLTAALMGTTAGEAKMLVMDSVAWSDRREATERLHRSVREAIESSTRDPSIEAEPVRRDGPPPRVPLDRPPRGPPR